MAFDRYINLMDLSTTADYSFHNTYTFCYHIMASSEPGPIETSKPEQEVKSPSVECSPKKG